MKTKSGKESKRGKIRYSKEIWKEIEKAEKPISVYAKEFDVSAGAISKRYERKNIEHTNIMHLTQFKKRHVPANKRGWFMTKGYKWILVGKDCPNARRINTCYYIKEHRHVMQESLNRPLLNGEVVHHKDGDILNNDLSNLELFGSHSEHMRSNAACTGGIHRSKNSKK